MLSAGAEQAAGEKIVLDKESLKNLLEAKIRRANFTRIARDTAIFMQRKEEQEYFKEEYFLSAVKKGLL